MARKRRKRGDSSDKEAREKSKNFFIMLAVIGGLLLLGFIVLQFI